MREVGGFELVTIIFNSFIFYSIDKLEYEIFVATTIRINPYVYRTSIVLISPTMNFFGIVFSILFIIS